MLHVALLYTVIVTQDRRVKAAELLAVAAHAGLWRVRTVLSTGNLVFVAEADEATIVSGLEAALFSIYGKHIPVFARAAPAWRAMVAANPFPVETAADPSRVAVRVMRDQPAPGTVTRIAAVAAGGEGFAVTDRAMWLTTPTQLSTSPLLRAIGAPWAGAGTLRSASALAKITAVLDGQATV